MKDLGLEDGVCNGSEEMEGSLCTYMAQGGERAWIIPIGRTYNENT